MRTGMGKIAALVAVLVIVIYGTATAWVTSKERGTIASLGEPFVRAHELAAQQAKALEAATGLPPLEAACREKWKLPSVLEVAAYSFGGPGAVDGDSYLDISNRLIGFYAPHGSDGRGAMVEVRADAPPEPWPFAEVFVDNLIDPSRWGRASDPDETAGNPDLRKARFLLVTQAAAIAFPQFEGDVYLPGKGELRSRVVTFPEGELVCEGVTEPTTVDSVKMEGRGKTSESAQDDASRRVKWHVNAYFRDSALYTPLHSLCGLGPKELCEQTARQAKH